MINYSLSLRANPLDSDADKKYYASPQYTEVMDLSAFSKHIASHGCVYARADIQAVLTLAVDCIKELMLQGQKIQLGDLGSFWLSLKSKGRINAADFVAANDIKRVNTLFTPGPLLKNLKDEADFNQVPNRKIQKATIKTLNGEKTAGGTSGKKQIVYTVAVTSQKK